MYEGIETFVKFCFSFHLNNIVLFLLKGAMCEKYSQQIESPLIHP